MIDIKLDGMRDRRIAASDESRDVAPAPRLIFGRGSSARRVSEQIRPGLVFDAMRYATDRTVQDISDIVLHHTAGNECLSDDIPSDDHEVTSSARLDRVIAHFCVLTDGMVIYTHDLGHILNDGGGRRGIDIEFTGDFSHERVPPAMGTPARAGPTQLLAGRRLITALKEQIPSITHIHPHGQIQTNGTGKRDSCPGPDVWVNVGEWAVRELGLISEPPLRHRPPRPISRLMRNQAYLQQLEGDQPPPPADAAPSPITP